MPTQDQFPKSVVLHFPQSVYQKIDAAEMLPKLLEILKIEDLRCVQFLRKVHLSIRKKSVTATCQKARALGTKTFQLPERAKK